MTEGDSPCAVGSNGGPVSPARAQGRRRHTAKEAAAGILIAVVHAAGSAVRQQAKDAEEETEGPYLACIAEEFALWEATIREAAGELGSVRQDGAGAG